ncbi:MAG: DoxX family protein [Chlamydiota bacterium]
MQILQRILLFLGRLFLSSIFLLSAVQKLFHWQEAKEGLVYMLASWQVISETHPAFGVVFSHAVSWSSFFLIVAIALELVGGGLIVLGWQARLGAFLLLLFLLPTTIIFHHFWYFEGLKRDIELAMFLKNIAILGGILYVLVHGSSLKRPNSLEK